jgi:hypothetical protein
MTEPVSTISCTMRESTPAGAEYWRYSRLGGGFL